MYSREEENWFKKFQEGTFLVKGWKSRIKDTLKPFSSPEKENLHQQLEILGEKIGREWSRDNSLRRIDTPMLQKWGNDLLAAKDGGSEILVSEIKRLNAEVERLLS
ncbi:MAG: hypothetical protein HQK62_01360 [Desulfamplus sp.]|nr:hypothetical protein [Desulfamplus sp.]